MDFFHLPHSIFLIGSDFPYPAEPRTSGPAVRACSGVLHFSFYLKYFVKSPLKAEQWRASSLAISWTVS